MIIIIISFLIFLIRLAIEFKCCKLSLNSLPSKFNVTNIGFDRFFDILLTITEFFHIPEHAFLTYYLFQFIKHKSWNDRPALIHFMKRKLIIIVGIISLALVILLPVFRLKLQIEISQQSANEQCYQSIGHVIIVLDFIYHVVSIIIILFVRFMMMYFTLMIGLIWKTEGASDHERNALLLPQNSNQEQHSDQEDFYMRCYSEYKKREKHVTPIYEIFRIFFVLQWTIHLFGFVFHCSHLTRTWIKYGQEIVIDASPLVTLYRGYQFLHLIFDCLALVVAHMCAMKMNYYAKQYIEKLEPGQQAKARIHEQYNSFKGSRDPYFVPELPGAGVNIPLNSVFTLAFGIFGLILTFIFL